MFTYIPKFNDLTDVVYNDFRNNEEREFVNSLYSYASAWEKYSLDDEDFIMFYDGDTLTVAFDIIGKTKNCVLRSLRIDLNETNLLLGEDISMQYVCKLDVNDSDVKVYKRDEYSIKNLSKIAVDWIVEVISLKN